MLIRMPFSRIINVSKGVKKRLVKEYKLKPKKIKVIHNGIDIDYIDSVKVKSKEKNTSIIASLRKATEN